MFPTIGFLALQILSIVESHVETKRIVLLTRILINLRRCHLQIEILEKIIFVNKNWHSENRM